MSRRYPPEVHDFIREHVEGLTCAELARLTNEKVGTDFDEVRMHSYKCSHHLKSGTKAGKPKGWSPVYPEDMADYMRSIARGRNCYEIAKLINEHYGKEIIDATRVRAYKKNHGITSELDCRFKKGHEPVNKGLKQTDYMSPEAIERTKATHFKPQQKPHNLLQVGAVVKNAGGYLLRKKQMEGTQWERWDFLHRATWEEHKGPIPEGMMVSFKDGNKENVDIDNLMLISSAENLELQRSGLRFEDPDLTETGLNVVKLKIKARGRRNEQRRVQRPNGGAGAGQGRERREGGRAKHETISKRPNHKGPKLREKISKCSGKAKG